MIRTVLVDDEQPARAELRYLLEQFSDMEIIGEFESGFQALENIPGLQPDALFMDVHLQDMDGLDVIQALQRHGVNAFVIFATAYDEYAVRAFELKAVDYVLKPFAKERIALTIEKIRERARPDGGALADKISQLIREVGLRQRPRKLAATNKGRVTLVDPQDVLYAVSEGRYASLVTEDKIWPTTFNLQEVEERLDPAQFVRTHRSYIVNLDRVKEAIPWFNGTYKIVIDYKGAEEIPVSRTYVKQLKEKLDF